MILLLVAFTPLLLYFRRRPRKTQESLSKEETTMSITDVVIGRLEDQIKWHDKESCRSKFKSPQTPSLAISVSIPPAAAFIKAIITAVLDYQGQEAQYAICSRMYERHLHKLFAH